MLKAAKATENSSRPTRRRWRWSRWTSWRGQDAGEASAPASSKAQGTKEVAQAAEAADDAQDARDMADDLHDGGVCPEWHGDDDDLMAELQQMMDDDPNPPGAASMTDVSLDETARATEIANLEARLARYDQSMESRKAVQQMPAAPTATPAIRANGKARMQAATQLEKQALLASASNGHM